MLSGVTIGNLLLKRVTVNVPLVHREYATGQSIASRGNMALAVQIPEGAIGRNPILSDCIEAGELCCYHL